MTFEKCVTIWTVGLGGIAVATLICAITVGAISGETSPISLAGRLTIYAFVCAAWVFPGWIAKMWLISRR